MSRCACVAILPGRLECKARDRSGLQGIEHFGDRHRDGSNPLRRAQHAAPSDAPKLVDVLKNAPEFRARQVT